MLDNATNRAARKLTILAVFDTQGITDHYPDPSTSSAQPTPCAAEHCFMLCSGTRELVSPQGGHSLEFKAQRGDDLSFRGISSYGNSDDAVIAYAIGHSSASNLLSRFAMDVEMLEQAATPNDQTEDGLPAIPEPVAFGSLKAKVRRHGRETLAVDFALYRLAADGEAQQLYGYFRVELNLTLIR